MTLFRSSFGQDVLDFEAACPSRVINVQEVSNAQYSGTEFALVAPEFPYPNMELSELALFCSPFDQLLSEWYYNLNVASTHLV